MCGIKGKHGIAASKGKKFVINYDHLKSNYLAITIWPSSIGNGSQMQKEFIWAAYVPPLRISLHMLPR